MFEIPYFKIYLFGTIIVASGHFLSTILLRLFADKVMEKIGKKAGK